MSILKKVQKRRARRAHRVRNSFRSKGIKPRVSVSRSLKHISAQLVDDSAHTTLVSFSSRALSGEKLNKTEMAHKVGLELSKKAQESSVKEVFFDRGRFLFHGRVKALAQGLRDGGLQF